MQYNYYVQMILFFNFIILFKLVILNFATTVTQAVSCCFWCRIGLYFNPFLHIIYSKAYIDTLTIFIFTLFGGQHWAGCGITFFKWIKLIEFQFD